MKKLFTALCAVIFAVAMTVSMVACTPLTYNITFLNYDGSELLTTVVGHNQQIVYEGENPQKQADEEYTYFFIGWMNADGELLETLPIATAEVSFTAAYGQIDNYKVQFVNGDEVLQSEVLTSGSSVEYFGATPTKPADAQYTYTFVGWSDGENEYAIGEQLPVLTAHATYYAIYSSTVNEYSVTWNVLGVESSKTYKYGELPAFGSVPEKEGDAQYSYTFAGWSLTENGEVVEVSEVVGAVTYYAVFTQSVNSYKVSFLDENGKLLYEDMVKYGSSAQFKGELPVRENTAQYTYQYLGWIVDGTTYSFIEALPAITGETSYKLDLLTTVNEYVITWVVEGEETSKKWKYGETPEFKGTPAKDGTAEFEYEFAGWSLTENGNVIIVPAVTGTAIYYATFNAIRNSYEVAFVTADGVNIQTISVLYGEVPVATATLPEKQATAKYSYYPAWTDGENVYDIRSEQLPAAIGATTYVLTYIEEINQYTITVNYSVESSVVNVPASKSVTLDYGTTYGKEETQSPAVTGFSPNRLWFAGILTEDVVYSVNYTPVNVWDGSTATAYESGSGTEKDPYIIKTGAQLAYLAKLGMDNTTKKNDVYGAGMYYKLGASIDLSAHNWTPIAFRNSSSSYDWTYFGGVFDGAGYTITMNITSTKFGYGLFQCLGGSGVVKNLTIAGGINVAHRAGAVAYISGSNTTIENVHNYADVITTGTGGYVGGLIGSRSGIIANCTNYGAVAGGLYTGGIHGEGSTGSVSYCVNYGAVSVVGDKDYVAGISGRATNAAEIIRCENYGTITGARYTAGIAGYVGAGSSVGASNASKVLGCVNYGAVIATTDSGGIAGLSKGIVSSIVVDGVTYDCINYAAVAGNSFIGGIVGNTESALTEYAINYGEISGGGSIGGILSQTATSSLTQLCVNYGTINGQGSNVAGVSGYVGPGSSVLGCINHGNVTNTSTDTGGIAGENKGYVGAYVAEDETVYYTINYGVITSHNNNLGGITGYNYTTGATTADAINYGAVIGATDAEYVGGIVGENSSGNVVNGVNYANITCRNSYIAGCVGRNNGGSVSDLTNYGTIVAERAASKAGTGIGGVIGSNQNSATASKLYNYGDVHGYTQVGGVSGYQGAGSSIDVAENHGNIYSYAGGSVGQIVGANKSTDLTTNVVENGTATKVQN